MCGISGLISKSSQSVGDLARLTAFIRHRGPDDEGYLLFESSTAPPLLCGGADTPGDAYNSDVPYAPSQSIDTVLNLPVNLAFGHRRLSIVDLSPLGHQPMCTSDRRYWITYNGEVYNYLELRQELEVLGHRFLSQTDTEVILAAYAQWGSECLHRFNGMWAFAIYDTQKQEVFLARDRFGIKPLYYWIAPNGTFCFASEIKQFTAFPGWKANVNPQCAYDFLVWGLTDHTDETLFSAVYQLRPGQCLHLPVSDFKAEADGRVPAQQWYNLEPTKFSGSFEDAAIEFRQGLTDAVQLRLRADVPIGSCLSGGLDSSAIVCIINNLLHEQDATALQKTFSACTNVKRFDERDWIDIVVRSTGVDAHYVYPGLEKLFEESPIITWHQDEPFGSTSIYAQWNVFRLAAENGVKVMLDGQGADEQLAGYHGFFAPRFAGLLRSGRLLQLWQDIQQTKQLHGHSEMRALMYIANMLLPQAIKPSLRSLFGKVQTNPTWLNLKVLGAQPQDLLSKLGAYTDSIQAMSKAQLTATNLQMLLHWEDRDSMAHSIESRVPFLDYRLVEFVLGLPDDFKLAEGVTKRVQRVGMKGVLPDQIRDRMDKLGFVTPEEVWVREQASDVFRHKLQQAVDASQGILTSESSTMLEKVISGRQSFSFLPWRLISFGEWMKTFSIERK